MTGDKYDDDIQMVIVKGEEENTFSAILEASGMMNDVSHLCEEGHMEWSNLLSFFLSHFPLNDEGRHIVDEELLMVAMEEISKKVIDATLSELYKKRLLDVAVDGNGEFVFYLTEDGKKVTGKEHR